MGENTLHFFDSTRSLSGAVPVSASLQGDVFMLRGIVAQEGTFSDTSCHGSSTRCRWHLRGVLLSKRKRRRKS